jgi:hypothetical protein
VCRVDSGGRHFSDVPHQFPEVPSTFQDFRFLVTSAKGPPSIFPKHPKHPHQSLYFNDFLKHIPTSHFSIPPKPPTRSHTAFFPHAIFKPSPNLLSALFAFLLALLLTFWLYLLLNSLFTLTPDTHTRSGVVESKINAYNSRLSISSRLLCVWTSCLGVLVSTAL